MLAEVISIGDELTSGQRLDTNSQWLSERLGEIGIRVMYHTTVADDLAANIRVFREAVDRADIVVVTGGLGPTADDLTRQALAEMLGVELMLDEPSLDYIRSLFQRRGRLMPERNIVQAQFPAGSRPVPNREGTAPGIDLAAPRAGRSPARVIALPGVPAEMKQMWAETVGPALATYSGAQSVICHHRVKCFGVGESQLEAMLPDLIRRGREPSVGITVHEGTITLRVTAQGGSAEACRAAMQPTLDTIASCLGSLVFGEGDDELQDALGRMLAASGKTLAVVEWGAGGLVQQWLSQSIAARGRFLGGVVISDAAAAVRCGAAPDTVHSPAGVEALALAAQRQFGADLTVVVGPFPPEDAERAYVTFALASAEGVLVRSVPFGAHSAIQRPLYGKRALNLVRRVLLGESDPKF